jgi:hypothetical protein
VQIGIGRDRLVIVRRSVFAISPTIPQQPVDEAQPRGQHHRVRPIRFLVFQARDNIRLICKYIKLKITKRGPRESETADVPHRQWKRDGPAGIATIRKIMNGRKEKKNGEKRRKFQLPNSSFLVYKLRNMNIQNIQDNKTDFCVLHNF